MIAWAIAFAVYAVAAVISLAPVLIAAFGKVKLNPGGPAFEEASHFSPEAKQKLTHNYDRMRGTLGFWKQQATKYERLHLYLYALDYYFIGRNSCTHVSRPSVPE